MESFQRLTNSHDYRSRIQASFVSHGLHSLEYKPATLGRRTAFKIHVYDEKCSASPVGISTTSFTVNYIMMSKFAGIGSI